MDGQIRPIAGRLNIEKLGRQLHHTSTGEEMRMVICPTCSKADMIDHKTALLKCTCGQEIIITERWFEI